MSTTMPDRLRVLVVDDHPGIVKSLNRLLSLDYHVVGSLTDGAGVCDAVCLLHPDVIVMDVNLPTVDGLTACRQVMQHAPDMKVIVFTAVEDPDLRQRAFDAGAYAFVSKLGSTDLLSVIRRIA